MGLKGDRIMGSYYDKINAQKDQYNNERDNYSGGMNKRSARYPTPKTVVSAFRANKTNVQPVTPNRRITVTFEDEQFDFGNEYDGVSTFTANRAGVYSIVANVFFDPTNNAASYSAELDLVVNDVLVATEVKTIPPSKAGSSFAVSTIYELQQGDTVRVLFNSNASGTVSQLGTLPLPQQATHFAAVIESRTSRN